MKVLLHNSLTDLYLLEPDPNMWTNDPLKAFNFGRVEDAVELARRAALQDLEMVVSFSTVPGNVRLPIGDIAWTG